MARADKCVGLALFATSRASAAASISTIVKRLWMRKAERRSIAIALYNSQIKANLCQSLAKHPRDVYYISTEIVLVPKRRKRVWLAAAFT